MPVQRYTQVRGGGRAGGSGLGSVGGRLVWGGVMHALVLPACLPACLRVCCGAAVMWGGVVLRCVDGGLCVWWWYVSFVPVSLASSSSPSPVLQAVLPWARPAEQGEELEAVLLGTCSGPSLSR